MHGPAQFHVPCTLSTQEVAVAWTILLKDYLGSSHVSYLITEELSCGKVESTCINLEIDDQETVGSLSHIIQQQLQQERINDAEIDQLTPFRTHLHITSSESDEGSNRSNEPVISLDTNTHFALKCVLIDNGRKLHVTTVPSSNTESLRILQQFECVLHQICQKDLNALVYSIHTASEADKSTVWEWNRSHPIGDSRTALEVFLGHVRTHPKSPAVSAWDGELTYEELDELSNIFAHQLIDTGVGRGNIVPLCFEKSKWTPVAIWSVIKTGAAFVLLDQRLPDDRIRQIAGLIEKDTPLILSSASQRPRAELLGSHLIIIDSEYLETKSQSLSDTACSSDNESDLTPSDPIYVVFTSGTTGVPKAAILSHQNICTFAKTSRELSDISRDSRVLAWASYAFDVSLGDTFLSLLSGACLCIPSSWECENDVGRIVDTYQITHAMVTPSVSKMMQPLQSSSLKVLNLCGEPCTEDALSKWRGTQTRVMNTYGPAECTVTSVGNYDALLFESPSIIGKGLAGCWIMDPVDHGRLTPIGGIGELVVEGPLVGLGYLHDETASRAKFYEDPKWLQDGHPSVVQGRRGRLYRTGDLVRYTDNGEIEYIGRRDSQVKIRGQRVELGEASTQLQPYIPSAIQWSLEVITLRNGAAILVVFFAIDSETKKSSILRKMLDQVTPELKKKLPSAMIPGAYVNIDRIPLTMTGKVDHRKLREIGTSLPPDRITFVAAAGSAKFPFSTGNGNDNDHTNGHEHPNGKTNGETENHADNLARGRNDGDEQEDSKLRLLKQAWSAVLRIDIDRLGSSTSFFALGGESLMAIRLVSTAAQMGLQLDVATIFRYPLLADLARESKLTRWMLQSPPQPFSLLEGEANLVEIAKACGTEVGNIEDAYPCTPLQEGLITNSSTTYTGRGRYALPKHVNIERFIHAWQVVARTHRILRTRIVDTLTHGLVQVVLYETNLFWDSRESLAMYLEEDNRREMTLGTELCRWGIVRELGTTYFILTMHHSIYDGWTLPRIGAEVFRAYQGIRIEPDIGFNTYIKYVRDLPLRSAQEFWVERLAEPEKTSVFPALPYGIYQPKADSTKSRSFSAPLNDHQGVSMPSLLRAAWALLVSTLSGNDDVTFGATVAGRNIPISGIEGLLSPTISTVPVRHKIDRAQSVSSFVAAVQDQTLQAVPFENLGLQAIRKINADTRKGSRFQTLFVVHPRHDSSIVELSPTSSSVEQELKTMLENLNISSTLSDFNEFSLMILVTQTQGDIVVEANYDSRVISDLEADLLLEQFVHFSRQLGLASNFQKSLQDLQLVSDREIKMIWQWNRKEFAAVEDCIQDIIARSYSGHPYAEAIFAWDGNATFSEVDELSSRLCLKLQSIGVGRGNLVPICMEKSKWATISMLGILKTGAGFVAMDVRHQPKKRLMGIIEQISAKCIVTHGPAATLARSLCKEAIVWEEHLLDTDNIKSELTPVKNLPSDTAFVVFTSGSTGAPKGIIITHENFCSTIEHHARELKLSRESRIFDFASYSFDIAVHNSLMALCLGACLCVPSEDDRENDIEASFERLRANWADITPSVARLINPTEVPGLQTLVLSGEAVGKDLVQRWANEVNLINAYGPAECQICTVQSKVTDVERHADIGFAVGCKAWILEPASNNLSPIGAIGELIIEGPIVSPSYLQSSNNAFVDYPIWLREGVMSTSKRRGYMYRTGDLVRYRPDGTIVYIGRVTTQTKINGQRVEFGEIEYHIQRLAPNIESAVVDVVDYAGVNLLTAFVVSNDSKLGFKRSVDVTIEPTTPSSRVLDELKESLPAYMVPTVFLNTSHIPLTSTRKADRRFLRSRASSLSRYQLVPQIKEEKKTVSENNQLSQLQLDLRQIWAWVLKVEPSVIGLSSDFFQLGGDSISAMRLVKRSRMKRILFTVADVFRHSQLKQLSDIAVPVTKDDESLSDEPVKRIAPFNLIPIKYKESLLSTAAATCKVPHDEIVDIYPCTAFQEAVFALTAGNSSAYVQHTLLRLKSNSVLDRALAAWDAVIAANPILRTRIIQSEETQLYQVVIDEKSRQSWRWYETSSDYLLAVSEIPMGLGNSLFHFGLVRDNSTPSPRYLLIWTMHHAVYDAWSMDLVLRQVSEHYRSQTFSTLVPNYNIFVDFLQRQESESSNWWRSYLSGASNASIYPKSPMSSRETSGDQLICRQFDLPHLSRPGYSSAVILRTAWAILMARHTGGESVVFGETRLGRNVPLKTIDRMPGPTIASAPLLVRIDRNQTIESLLTSVREDSLRMQDFEHLGLQYISRLSDDARAACNFQTLLVFLEDGSQSEPHDSIFEIDHTVDDIRNFNTNYLLLYFTLQKKALVTTAVFREHAIAAGQVELLLEQVQSIFSSLCSLSPSTLIKQLDIAGDEDLARIWAWNETGAEEVDEYIHDLIAQNAIKHPEKLAVLAHDGQMTYKELDEYSNNLAAQLRAQGIGLNSFVPLCFEKSFLVPVAMLAVIKTGAAFSVMDVSYPESRLKIIADALEAHLVITSPSQLTLARRLAERVFVVGEKAYTSSGLFQRQPIIDISLRNTDRLMYVCFTSGSTGVPKGVMVTHKNLSSAAVGQTRELAFDPEDRVYDFSSHAFDANIWHFFLGLVVGACVCIPSHEDRVGNLARSISSFQSTALFLTPSVARTIDPTEIPTVKRLYLGGEAVTPLDVSMWKDNVDLWGAYGPTETTPLCIFTRLSAPNLASNIGRGVGVRSWVCDPDNHETLVAVGAIGELVNEGPLVTKGYLNQPQKTAEVFIENPDFLRHGFSGNYGRKGRLYRTGDLVRYNFDGTIQYLGRADTQVKLRGQRVEFGEIEYHLKSLLPESISICEVIKHPTSGQPTLVAFCSSTFSSSSSSTSLDTTRTKAHLSKSLPPYMIPEFFIPLPQIPRNPSGKIDRLKLRALGPELLHIITSREEYSDIERIHGPLTKMETLLSTLWIKSLGGRTVPVLIDTDFVDIGGDSIAAMKLSNISRRHDLDLTVKDIIQYPKLSSMALRVHALPTLAKSLSPFTLINSMDRDRVVSQSAEVCNVSRDSIIDIYPATPVQTELVALTLKQPQAYIKRSIYDIPFHINIRKLIDAWNKVYSINDILRTRFVELEGFGLLQVVVKEYHFRQYDNVQSYLNDSINQGCHDLGQPFSYLALIDDGKKSPKIAWTVHHALYDEWSILIIEEQLRRAYKNKIMHPPPKFSVYVSEILSRDKSEANLFWKKRLTNCSGVSLYPALPLKSYQVQPSKTLLRTISPKLRPGVNIQAKIYGALALVMSKLTGCSDVVFAATLTGRNAAVEGIEQIVGPTITPVPIRIQVHREGQENTGQFIQRIERDTADMSPHQHIGIKSISMINEDTRAACNFQTLVVITLKNAESGSHVSETVRISSYEATSKEGEAFHTFALVLFFFPSADHIDIEVVYDPFVLNKREIQRLLGRMDRVLSLLDRNNVPLDSEDFDCLGAEDLDDISTWNSHIPVPSDRLLHEVILQQSHLRPSDVAIDAWDCKFTYSQIDRMSDALCGQLVCQYGIGRGSIIPILSTKSGYVPIAALAILKAGAIFIPLDGTTPVGRLKMIVDEVRPSIILATQSSLAVAADLVVNVVLLNSYDDTIAKAEIDPPSVEAPRLDDVACILFTSGSTGTPKGVMQTHQALSTAIEQQAAYSDFTDSTRAFEFASYGFDVSWNMIFKVLAMGGTLCVPSEEDRRNDLLGAMNRSRATLTELTASVARLLDFTQLPHLSTLILSGEPVDMRDFEYCKPRVRVIVCYGPSECTSVSTMNPGLQSDSSRHGIGKGCGSSIWLVDPEDYRRLVPIGAVGEILIHGSLVGKGYYNSEELTRASYIPVNALPWMPHHANNSSQPAFLSGDLARYDTNGNLHFVSRKDLQVKLHGQRIELEEVQYHVRALLDEHVGPVICCILSHPQKNTDPQQLVSFLSNRDADTKVPCKLTAPNQDALRALQMLEGRLGTLLPRYMIPSAYYFITTIPRTNNGKADRKALAEIAASARTDQIYRGRATEQDTKHRAPSTANEATMQGLWAVALNLPTETIGADDNFFNLNGDSISAMRLVAIARKKGLDLRVSDVFATPKLSELAQRLVSIDHHTQDSGVTEIRPFELLAETADARQLRPEAAKKCVLTRPDDVEDIYPCTPLQRSMLAATIRDPNAFISRRLYRIPLEVEESRLRDAWAAVVARHKILRTRLVDLDDYGLHQVVVRESSLLWNRYDDISSWVSSLTGAESMGPTTRLTRWAFIDGPNERYLIWTIHHATYDGWILPVIESEVKRACYHPSEELGGSYLDMRPLVKYILNEPKAESVSFWSQQLANADQCRIYPALPSNNHSVHPATYLEKKISARVNRITGIGLSALLYGSWSILVSHLTGSQKVSFGAILTGRNAPIDGIDKVIGPAVTTVPVVVDSDPALTVQEFMAQLHDMTAQRIPHEHLGIQEIRSINEACEIACSFQTVLVIQPPQETQLHLDSDDNKELRLMEEMDETQIKGFPDQYSVLNQYGLMLEIIPMDEIITVRASFDSLLISKTEIERQISRWGRLIGQILDSLNKKIPVYVRDLISTCDKDLDDIWRWNKDVPRAISSPLICQKVREMTNTRPDALAIDAWDGQLTYRNLDVLSSRLAKYLVKSGIRRGQFVPLLFRKSMWANVAMLAVSKANGAFVPLDANHPEGHLRAIMQALDTDIVLCAGDTRDRAARLAQNAVIAAEAAASSDNPDQDLEPNMAQDIAYAVFTSGSTGAAKGVKISHQNLATAIYYQAGAEGYQINSRTRSLDSSSYSFDACVCNFFYTVTQGGCLCVPSDESLKGDLGTFMRDKRVNWAQLVPSVARTINKSLLPDLNSLVLTGEPMSKGDIETWAPSVRLINAYGPTECTILCAISSRITNPEEHLGFIGCGRGATLWLADADNPNKLAPVGATGEILIEGPIIGLGYLGPYQYPLVENPPWLLKGWKGCPGRTGKLYRTGDLARYREDGSLVFIGRIGSEIKLRGQRVDIGAIEDVLRRSIPLVIELAAEIIHVNFGNVERDRQLLAVFVAASETASSQIGLRTQLESLVPFLKLQLGTILPAYLQPEAFLPLPSIPKTSSGKTDRRRLKALEKQIRPQELIWISGNTANSATGSSLTAPVTHRERVLAELWVQVLRIEYGSIRRKDDFFRLGGDSLSVMRLSTKAHARGFSLKSSDIFQNPKLMQLAEKMTEIEEDNASIMLSPYKPYSLITGISDIEEFIASYVTPSLGVNVDQIDDIVPANGFQVDYIHNQEEPLGLQYAYIDIGENVSWFRLVEACQTVVQNFQCMRARFLHHQGKYYQVILRDAPLTTEAVESSDQITTFCNQFCPADARNAQLSDTYTKLILVKTRDKRRVLLRVSHNQMDGWCLERILKEIANVFNGGEMEKTPEWTSLLQYRHQTAAASMHYWRNILEGSAKITSPLVYKPEGDNNKVRTLRSFALPYFHTAEDNRRTRPAVVVNVAWALVLQRLASHDDVVFGNITTGRDGDMPGLDSVVGPCVNMLPFRLRLPSSDSGSRQRYLRNLVEASAQQADDRTSHEGLNWDEMVNRCTTWPSGSRYSSAVHFRNMAFEPELMLGNDRVVVTWYELVARPHWTTVLVYPESDDVLRLWLLANPDEIGDEGADEILQMLLQYCNEIVEALADDQAHPVHQKQNSKTMESSNSKNIPWAEHLKTERAKLLAQTDSAITALQQESIRVQQHLKSQQESWFLIRASKISRHAPQYQNEVKLATGPGNILQDLKTLQFIQTEVPV
ncbi:nonribosomal peptide synthase, putative [Talaromyces stipitatus ATCC 10500]|uniref:Nonribosomal peptide synthase, putative n=1 Tax=Talaromyces stipitatus (strain ATCC 10500 / CBS 375.48 / QM 6759 / NRRL 1006) TaxID=441959 RepID=B8M8T3_TALSN|nr:nonribosomal peptide synthase, putative [Talaromyces stipitatus ATCC 10500]EED20596.1 nonribosomal peptide synthase, putative [Talaromyces stipitatus ATCC 10500]